MYASLPTKPRAARVPPIVATWTPGEARRHATRTPAEARREARTRNAGARSSRARLDRLARRVRNDDADDEALLEQLREMIQTGECTEDEARQLLETAGIDPARLLLVLAASTRRGRQIDVAAVYARRNQPSAASSAPAAPATPPARPSRPPTLTELARRVYGDGTSASAGVIPTSRRGGR